MRISGTALLLLASTAWAQQSPAPGAGTTLPLVQAAGGATDRPGGISHVTRQRSTVGTVNVVNAFWASSGVPVVTAAGANGVNSATPPPPGAVAVQSPNPPITDPQALMRLHQLAARGDLTAQRALSPNTPAIARPMERRPVIRRQASR